MTQKNDGINNKYLGQRGTRDSSIVKQAMNTNSGENATSNGAIRKTCSDASVSWHRLWSKFCSTNGNLQDELFRTEFGNDVESKMTSPSRDKQHTVPHFVRLVVPYMIHRFGLPLHQQANASKSKKGNYSQQLKFLDHRSASKCSRTLVAACLVPLGQLVERREEDGLSAVAAHEGECANDNLQLFTIQVQAMLRFALWSALGSSFVQQYYEYMRKRGGKHKKKKPFTRKQAAEFLRDDTIQILQLAAFYISLEKSFGEFLEDCMPFSLVLDGPTCFSTDVVKGKCDNSKVSYEELLSPSTIRYVFDFFEVPNPYDKRTMASGREEKSSSASIGTDTPMPRKRKAKRKAPGDNTTHSGKESSISGMAVNDAKPATNESSLFSQKHSLTAPVTAKSKKRNSLLRHSGRSNFLGSHFNTTLSNAQALFRQVKVQPPRKKNFVKGTGKVNRSLHQQQKKQLLPKIQRKTHRQPRAPGQSQRELQHHNVTKVRCVQSATVSSPMASSVLKINQNKSIVQETPIQQSKNTGEFLCEAQMRQIPKLPGSSKRSQNSIVLETPVPRRNRVSFFKSR